MAMIRPREGGFFYSESEFATMERELDELVAAGADGVVFGILLADGSIDQPRMEKLRRKAGDLPVMCHRAFDVTPDPLAAIDALVDAGVDRVLSSGQTREILTGLPELRRIMDHAVGRIVVQPCEGIRANNVALVVDTLEPSCIHFGPFVEAMDPTSRLGTEVDYGHHMVVDEDAVRAVIQRVRGQAPQV
jgi:copper homeostasis protein